MMHLVKAAVAALFLSSVAAQDVFEFLTEPQQKFAEQGGAIGAGNAVSISPDGLVLYVTRADGTLDGLDPETGTSLTGFPIDPSTFTGGSSHTCQSGIFVHPGDELGDGAYVVYSVITEEDNTYTAAISHPDGAVLWAQEVSGIAAGTPVISALGDFVYLTHNENGLGSFTVLDASDDGSVFYTEANANGTFAYTAPAIYHNPAYGNYIGGFDPVPNNPSGLDNTNDILAWAATAIPFSNAGGQTFAFQLPVDYATGDDNSNFEVRPLTSTSWLSRNPPTIAADGLRQYYGISRNQFRVWIPSDTLRGRWDESALASTDDRWGRGNPRFNDPETTPTVTSDATTMFVGLANPIVVSLVADVATLDENWQKATGSLVLTKPVLAHDESAIYFAESDPAIIHSTMAADGTDYFAQALGAGDPVSAEMSVSPDGTTLYFAQNSGVVYGWQVGSTGPAPTASPTTTQAPTALVTTTMPTGAPSTTPMPTVTAAPTTAPTSTLAPTTAAPTAEETTAATPPVTSAPDTPPPTPAEDSPPPTPFATDAPSAASQTSAMLSLFAAFAVAFLLK